MKKILLLIFFLPLLACAQQNKGQIVLSGGMGKSLLGLIKLVDFSGETQTTVTPVYVGSLEVGFNKHFSIGLSGGYQKVSMHINDWEWTDQGNVHHVDAINWSIARLNVGPRFLVHYGVEHFDFYSGLHVAYNNNTISTDAIDPDFTVDFSGGSFGFQVTVFGARGYIGKNVGLFTEFAIGAPSFINGGITIAIQTIKETE